VDLPGNNLTRWQEFMLALAKAGPALTHTLGGALISTISGSISILVAGGTLHLIAFNYADFNVFTLAGNANKAFLTAHTAFLALMTNSETVITIAREGVAVVTEKAIKVTEGVIVATEAGATLSRMGEIAAQWNHLGVQIIDHLTRVSISTTDIIQTGGDVIYQLFTQGGVTVLVASGAGLAGSMVFVMLRPHQVAEIMLRLARRG
jgi:hypothetical protein